jgi:hypothetical protein
MGAVMGLAAAAPGALAAGSPPAGGAAIGQVVAATLGAMVGTGAMLALVWGHRTGRTQLLARLARVSEKATGDAGWSSLGGTFLGGALLIAVFGMYWDISIHIDKGRDPGPLANPAHYFILVGLFGVLFAGVMSITLATRKPSNAAKRLPNGWWAPLGALVIVACSAVSLGAFPLDDGWHRLFGQDVTLWGPTHLLLIGGAAFSIVGQWILFSEAKHGFGDRAYVRPVKLAHRFDSWALVGSLLVGLSTFQAEFDFGVPQFRLVWQPLLLALAAGIGLTAARVKLGRGGAFAAALFFIGLRGLLALIVGVGFGRTAPHFPLYLAEAGLVELVALRIPRERPITLGAISGVLIGTIGFFAEYGWSHVWSYNAWPASMIVEGLVLATVAGVAGGVIGGFLGRSVVPIESAERVPRWAVPAAALAVVAAFAWTLPMPNGSNVPKATVTLTTVKQAPHRTVSATVRLDPPNAADNARWLNVTAWQGGGSVVNPLKKIGPGLYRTTEPIPIGGPKWKVTLRLQRGSAVLGLPIYLPADRAIPVKAVPAPPVFTRSFERDKKLLQREQKPGVSGILTGGAYAITLAVWLAMLAMLVWALRGMSRSIGSTPPSGPGRKRPAPKSRVAAAS